jgi:hypothetical protein
MPRSRTRKRYKRPSSFGRTFPRPVSGELKIDAMVDRAKRVRRSRGSLVPYHYTSWEAAENIIASQTFRATAHNCTNNPGELMSADATIIGEITIV